MAHLGEHEEFLIMWVTATGKVAGLATSCFNRFGIRKVSAKQGLDLISPELELGVGHYAQQFLGTGFVDQRGDGAARSKFAEPC